MTRDEAVRAFEGIQHPGSFSTEAWIDRFVALGMLRLDVPISADCRIDVALKASLGVILSVAERENIKAKLEAVGLKIVEK